MKKHNLILIACVFAAFITFFSTNVYAVSTFNINLQDFSYAKFLPVIVGVMLVVETLIIMFLSKIRRLVNVSFTVLTANIASFLVIRIPLGALRHRFFYSGTLINNASLTDWFILGLGFFVTLAVELPIIWFSLKPFTPKKNRLIWSAVAANTVSFIVITVFELYFNNLIF